MKAMSEAAAWKFLEKKWRNVYMESECAVVIGGLRNRGLCWCLNRLYDTKQISSIVRSEMIRKIPNRRNEFGYCWSLTHRGAIARANWCRKQWMKLKNNKDHTP